MLLLKVNRLLILECRISAEIVPFKASVCRSLKEEFVNNGADQVICTNLSVNDVHAFHSFKGFKNQISPAV